MSYDLPLFNAAEVAEITETKAGDIRQLRDRGMADLIGTKLENRAVSYSVREVAMISVVRDLTRLNFPVRVATTAAAALLEFDPAPDAIFGATRT